ncbi:MAG TPA: SRPBCC family protein [Gemmatimonadales bacterium]
MKWILIVAGVAVAMVVIVFVLGATRPKEHTASISFTLAKPDSVIWATVSNFEKVPEWNHDMVQSVRRIADIDGRPAYREKYGSFEMTNVVRELIPNRRIVRDIIHEGAFSGSWTFELEPQGQSTQVTITERGRVDNAFFRGLMAFGDNRATMKKYAAALVKKLGGA